MTVKYYNAKENSGDNLEDVIFDGSIVLPKGLYLEAYGNTIDGIFDEESSEGSSLFLELDVDISFDDLLYLLRDMGNVRDYELTIRVLEDFEEEEVELAKKTKVSSLK